MVTIIFKVLGGQRNSETRSTGGGKADRIKRPMNAFMVSLVFELFGAMVRVSLAYTLPHSHYVVTRTATG